MRKAIVEDATGLVKNVTQVEEGSDWSPPDGHSLIDAEGLPAEPGGTWDGSEFQPAPETKREKDQRTREAIDVQAATDNLGNAKQHVLSLFVAWGVLSPADAEALGWTPPSTE